MAAHTVRAQAAPPSPKLAVFVVGATADAGTNALLDIVRSAGHVPRLVERAACAPEALRAADVVLVDWPASDPLGERSPLGPFERWDRPTLLLGAAGDAFAQRWGLPTAAQMAALQAKERGPEMQELRPFGGAKLAGWRQGNLFHVALPAPLAELPAVERTMLIALIERASRFVTDRPILRYGAPAGAELPAAESERRERIAGACKLLDIDPSDRASLLAVLERDAKTDFGRSARLLADLVPESCDAATSRNNWKFWLQARADQLVWDALSRAWRVDLLAYWRGMPSRSCRDSARADGGECDESARALASKVVQQHGGRALADLATFSCWLGDVHYMWDRRRGWFRMENHHALVPGAFGTPWKVAVIDTAADEDTIEGGGPPPRPRVSARAAWRELVEREFLPAMLLDPGVALRRLPDQDADGAQALGVRLGGRGMDPVGEHVLLVDPETGAIVKRRKLTRGRAQDDTRIAATAACGPLPLPVDQVDERRNGAHHYTIVDAKWNPELPATIATATEQLSEPRAK